MERPVEYILRGGPFKQLAELELTELRKRYDLKRIEIEVLYFLSRSGKNNTVADIHNYLNANKGHISQTLLSLCEKGYLISQQDRQDRRYMHYMPTEAAQELAGKIALVWKKLHHEIFADIPEADMECFRRVSNQIENNINRILER